MAKDRETFGVIIQHSKELFEVGQPYGDTKGIVLHRFTAVRPTPEKPGLYEYKVSYGQGMREV